MRQSSAVDSRVSAGIHVTRYFRDRHRTRDRDRDTTNIELTLVDIKASSLIFHWGLGPTRSVVVQVHNILL